MRLLRNAPPIRVEEDQGCKRVWVCQAQYSKRADTLLVNPGARDGAMTVTYCSIISSGSLLKAD